MKIKKVRIKQLLKLNLLRSKVYEQPIKKMKFDNLIDSNLNQIIVDIKKVLQIIFQYHQIEKRILFVGLPYKLESRINKYTKHVAIPKNFDVQGMISNPNWKSLKNSKNSTQIWLKETSKFLLPKLTKRLDLVVLFEHDKSKMVRSEAEVAKIPLISFGTDLDTSNTVSYKVEGSFKNASNKNIFFIGLNFLFKNPGKINSKHF
jgi:ribosomal protein S2